MDFSCIDIRELLDSTLSKWFENPGDKSPNLDDLGIQLDCNDTTKDTSKDTKERFVEPSVIPQVYVNEYNEDINPTWTNMENAKWASKKEADLVGETDQEGDVFMYNYRSDQEEPKDYFFTDEIYPSGIEPRFYTKAEEETSQTSVVNNVVDNVKDSVSENVTPQVGGSPGAPRMYGTKPSGDKQMNNYAFELTTIEKLAAGYDGYSKSNNAIQAEEEGKFPLSQASKIVASNFGITQKQAKWLLEKIGPCEWHHTSSHYNRTDYYDTNENEIIDSVSSFVEDVSTKEDVVEYVTGNYQAPTITEEGYRADFDYIIWGGTRSHPKANKQHLENVYVVEKGSFYYVYDKKDGNLIVKKKIGSNGTYVHTLPTQEELDAKNKSESEYKALYNYNTSQETRDFIEAGGEWSNSGKFYPSGKKPSPEDYDNGLENFFEVGDTRVVSTEFKGGFIRQEWDGKQFVSAEDTSNMVGSYDELPEDAKNITSTFEFVGIDKLADLFGDGVRQDEIPDSENRFLNRSPITEVNKDQKEELMEKAKKVNKPVTYIPKDLNYPFIEDEMAGDKLFYTGTDFLLDDLYQ